MVWDIISIVLYKYCPVQMYCFWHYNYLCILCIAQNECYLCKYGFTSIGALQVLDLIKFGCINSGITRAHYNVVLVEVSGSISPLFCIFLRDEF